jgi:GDP-4-dehydro-6-deoxy-D-mannose reductase
MYGNDGRADAESMQALPFERILVTGAHGFVGRYLVSAIARRSLPGARIFLATRSAKAAQQHHCVPFDLEDPATIVAAIAKTRPDLVIHLAGQASVGRAVKMAADTWSINLCGSLSLAQALGEIVPDCTMLFVSSVEVYGLTFNHEIATEASALRPQSAYGRSKAAAEAMLADVMPASARLIVARPCNHTGPGQGETFVVPGFAAQIARIERGNVHAIRVGNLDAERDFLDVRDVVAAYLALLAGARVLPSRSIFNIASGRPVRIGDVLERLRALSTSETVVEQDYERMRPSEVSRAAVDVTAICRAVNWTPTHTLDETLAGVLAEQRSRADL